MTAPDPAALHEIADRIAEARRRVDALVRERDAAIVLMLGDRPAYGLIAEVARIAKVSRQRIDTIRRLAEARREGQRDPKS